MGCIDHVQVPDLGRFACAVPAEVTLAAGEACVCEFGHVQELATVLERDPSGAEEPADAETGRVLRKATEDDRVRAEVNCAAACKALAAFRQYAGEARLSVRAVKAHFSLRRERLLLWYAAETPVDVRQPLGHLQRQFATQVEPRPVGPREAAALVGGFGTCGRQLCCAGWLREPPPVTLPMARAQDLPLMPGAVNGQCGCMKCCLRYEFTQYAEAAAGMPPTGFLVGWPGGEGIVVARDILARRVTVKAEGRFLTLAVSELNPRSSPALPEEAAGDGALEENRRMHDEDSDS